MQPLAIGSSRGSLVGHLLAFNGFSPLSERVSLPRTCSSFQHFPRLLAVPAVSLALLGVEEPGNGFQARGIRPEPTSSYSSKKVEAAVNMGIQNEDVSEITTGASSPFALFSVAPFLVYPTLAEGTGYSQASYYTSLTLFFLSLPGIWSLVKRSTKSKIVKKTFVVPGPADAAGKTPSQIAGEITSFFTRSNFAVGDRGETVTFEGNMTPSRGQAAFLSFCTAVSLASLALVLSIVVPDVGEQWYWMTLLSPLAGVYYWTRASRKEQIKVRMWLSDDEAFSEVIVQGDDEQVDRLRRDLKFMEKGMVQVKGLFER